MRKWLVVSAVSATLVWAATLSAPTATSVAMVTGVYGGLTVERGGNPMPAKVRTMLQAGDTVRTDDRSRAVLLLADGSQIKLQYETTIQFSAGKGLKIIQGEVFASMAKQHGPFTFQVPNGKAGVVGTELDIEVAHASLSDQRDAVTKVTVAKGSVDFSGNGTAQTARAVRVASGTQSILALRKPDSHVAVTSVEAALEPTEPVQVDVDPIIAWNRQVQQYSDAISRLHDQYQLLEADTQAHGGFVSPTLMDQLNEDEELIQSLVPDDDFVAGHQDLLLAYQNYKFALTMSANPQLQAASLQKANSAYQAADLALKAYKIKYQSKLSGFLQH